MSGKSRVGKSTAEQIKAFNVAVQQYNAKSTDRSVEEIEKVLAVLNQVREEACWDLETLEVRSLVTNSLQLIDGLHDHKSSLTWALVNLLAKVATLQNAPRLRDEFLPIPVLARLLHSLPSTTHVRTAKLLELLLVVAQNLEMVRTESYLASLLDDLFSHMRGEDTKIKTLAAFILSTLLRKNFLVVQQLMTSSHQEELTGLLVSSLSGDQTSQLFLLIVESIEFRLGLVKLEACPPPPPKVLDKVLTRLSEALHEAFNQQNTLTIKFLRDYLEDISSCPAWVAALHALDTMMGHLTDILAIPKFDKLNPALWEMFFGAARVLVGLVNGDSILVFNKIIKVVLTRLETKPFTEVASSLALLTLSLERIDLGELSAADKRNLELQMDQMLPCIQTVFITSANETSLADSCSCRKSMLAALKLLVQLADQQQLAAGLSKDKMAAAFRKQMACNVAKPALKAELATLFLSLIKSLAGDESGSGGWTSLKEDLFNDKTIMAAVADVLRSKEQRASVSQRAVALLAHQPDLAFPSNTDDREGRESAQGASLVSSATPPVEDNGNYLTREQSIRLDQHLEKLSDSMARLAVNPGQDTEERILPEVLQLQLYLANKDQSEVRVLRGALEAADQQLKYKAWMLEDMNQKHKAHQQLLNITAARYSTARTELEHIRAQHSSFSKISQSRALELESQVESLDKELTSQTDQLNALTDKYDKTCLELKKQTAELEVVKQDREIQAQQIKDIKMSVSKRDDKLKKTMKQLEEVQIKLEEAERKREKLEKANQSLELLTKNQEEAIAKKDKASAEQAKELHEMRKIRDAIFNLSKGSNTSGSG